jgi:prevent-host-death family protein
MAEATHVSIGQVKRDISDMVNRVAYAHERIVLTSRGKPKAALVSMEDYARLQQMAAAGPDRWQAWREENDRLSEAILARREQEPIPVAEIWDAARADLEERDAATAGG